MTKDRTPALGNNPPPPSDLLNQKPQGGMVSQADMDSTADADPELRKQRRDNINPSLAREEPPEEGEL